MKINYSTHSDGHGYEEVRMSDTEFEKLQKAILELEKDNKALRYTLNANQSYLSSIMTANKRVLLKETSE